MSPHYPIGALSRNHRQQAIPFRGSRISSRCVRHASGPRRPESPLCGRFVANLLGMHQIQILTAQISGFGFDGLIGQIIRVIAATTNSMVRTSRTQSPSSARLTSGHRAKVARGAVRCLMYGMATSVVQRSPDFIGEPAVHDGADYERRKAGRDHPRNEHRPEAAPAGRRARRRYHADQ